MTKKEYAEILKAALQIEIDSYVQYLEEKDIEFNEDYHSFKECVEFSENYSFNEGILQGLQIARQKIENSMFLCEEE